MKRALLESTRALDRVSSWNGVNGDWSLGSNGIWNFAGRRLEGANFAESQGTLKVPQRYSRTSGRTCRRPRQGPDPGNSRGLVETGK